MKKLIFIVLLLFIVATAFLKDIYIVRKFNDDKTEVKRTFFLKSSSENFMSYKGDGKVFMYRVSTIYRTYLDNSDIVKEKSKFFCYDEKGNRHDSKNILFYCDKKKNEEFLRDSFYKSSKQYPIN